MALEWFRLDTGIGSHDKVLALLNGNGRRSDTRYRAAFSYVCSIGWAVNQGTDGHIPKSALPHIHGTANTADLLVVYRLWETADDGWYIRNFARRQQSASTTEVRRRDAQKAACKRWHPPSCWDEVEGCARAEREQPW